MLGPLEGRLHDDSPFLAISHDLLIRLGLDLRISAVNAAATRMLGFAPDGLIGRPLTDLIDPVDRANAAQQLHGAADIELATRMCASDNLYRSVLLRATRRGDELFVAVRERDEAAVLRADLGEARRVLAGMFECCQDYVLITDRDVVVTHVNRVADGLAETMVGRPMLSVAAPEELAAMTRRIDDVLTHGKTIAYETRARYPDGSLWDFSSRLAPVRDGDRNVGVVLITRDVTREKAAEAAKRFAEQQSREYMVQLERSNRELERFASIASHDLQEPLRKIQAFGDRLRDKFQAELAATGRDYLERIRSAAKRMQDLINDLLVFSRLSATEKAQARVDLGKVARSVLSDLEVRIEETGGKVVLGALPTIDADPLHMRQLLQNLVGNALKFARQGVPPVVEISAQVVPAGADPLAQPATCRISIADNGIGIEARYHDRIFGIFERLHGRGKYEGTGVGLAVCRKIVEQHHGSIEVSSVFGEGTSFTIVLPMTQPERGPVP